MINEKIYKSRFYLQINSSFKHILKTVKYSYMLKIIITIFIATILDSCYKSEYGYNFNNENIDKITSGVGFLTKKEIIKEFNKPTFTSYGKQNVIFYANEESQRFLFIRSINVERKILKLEFDKKEILCGYEWIITPKKKENGSWMKEKIPSEKEILNRNH